MGANGLNGPLGKYNGLKFVGALLAALAAVATIHAVIVIPGVLHAAGQESDKKIERHAAGLHRGTVSREEMNILRDHLDSQFESLHQRLALIDRRLERLDE